MGLKILTVKTKNSSSAYAGSVLFNSKYISNDMRLVNTDDSYFSYGMRSDDVVKDVYTVNETLTTADDVYASVSATFFTLPVYDDVNDSSSSTTNKPIDAEDIVKGIALPSDTTKSLLWIESGGKLDKILVNKPLETIEDYIVTGSTTSTSTTSTSSTTTA